MSSTRDVSADPTRTTKASASRGDRRLRKAGGRIKPSTWHATHPSQERFDQAVQSLRQLAEDVSHSAQDELAHILASEVEDSLSFIMDGVEQNASAHSTEGTKDQPQASDALRRAERDTPLPERTQQYRAISGSPPIRRRTWAASLFIAAQVIAVAAVLVGLARPLLTSGQDNAVTHRVEAHSGMAGESSIEPFGPDVVDRSTSAISSDAPSLNAGAEHTQVSGIAPSPALDHGGKPEDKAARTDRSTSPMFRTTEASGTPLSNDRPQTLPGKREFDARSSQIAGQQLLQRAQALLQNKDISGARLVLERAVSLGSAKAASQLAQTYDPSILDHWQVRGITGDKSKSQELHELARMLERRESGTASSNR